MAQDAAEKPKLDFENDEDVNSCFSKEDREEREREANQTIPERNTQL
jgi:hypothetical protein